MAISETFKDYVLEQLAILGDVTVRKMFGGAGIYYEGVIFGLLADDVLYFKVDDSNRSDFEKEGAEPFKPFDDKPYVMSYYEVPVEVLEDRKRLAEWARKSLFASTNTPSKNKKRNRKK